MTTVDWYQIAGETAILNREGWNITTKAVVSELSNTLEPYEKTYAGFLALGLTLYEVHPTYSYSYLQSVSATALSRDIIEYTLTYAPMTNIPIDIQISATGMSVQTNIDSDGNNIQTSYTHPANHSDSSKQNKLETIGQLIDKNVPSLTITITKTENITGSDLTDRAATYQGTLNNASWSLRPSDAERTWMCVDISGTWIGNVYTDAEYTIYRVSYTYQYIKGGWDSHIVFIDPSTGKPPDKDDAGYVAGTTDKEVQLYTQTNFSNLTLDV